MYGRSLFLSFRVLGVLGVFVFKTPNSTIKPTTTKNYCRLNRFLKVNKIRFSEELKTKFWCQWEELLKGNQLFLTAVKSRMETKAAVVSFKQLFSRVQFTIDEQN